MSRAEVDRRRGIRDESGRFPRVSERPGYGQPDAIDPSGYSLADRGMSGDGEISDVQAPSMAGRVSMAPHGDDTVRPTPGGALGEAGACSTSAALGVASLPVGLTGQHAIRIGEVGRGLGGDLSFGGVGRPDPLEYLGDVRGFGDRSREPSDSSVYRDLYGDGND